MTLASDLPAFTSQIPEPSAARLAKSGPAGEAAAGLAPPFAPRARRFLGLGDGMGDYWCPAGRPARVYLLYCTVMHLPASVCCAALAAGLTDRTCVAPLRGWLVLYAVLNLAAYFNARHHDARIARPVDEAVVEAADRSDLWRSGWGFIRDQLGGEWTVPLIVALLWAAENGQTAAYRGCDDPVEHAGWWSAEDWCAWGSLATWCCLCGTPQTLVLAWFADIERWDWYVRRWEGQEDFDDVAEERSEVWRNQDRPWADVGDSMQLPSERSDEASLDPDSNAGFLEREAAEAAELQRGAGRGRAANPRAAPRAPARGRRGDGGKKDQ